MTGRRKVVILQGTLGMCAYERSNCIKYTWRVYWIPHVRLRKGLSRTCDLSPHQIMHIGLDLQGKLFPSKHEAWEVRSD